MSMPRRFWQDMSSEEFAQLDAARVIAVLPVAAIEQHGPHLPVATDACINQGVLARALELHAGRAAGHRPAHAAGRQEQRAPRLSRHLTLSAETLIRLWTEVGEGVARAGIRKLVLFNSHGGQPQVMDIVARDLRVRHAMMVVAYSWYAGGLPRGAVRRGRGAARHPCRRDRDLDDAASATRSGADGPRRGFFPADERAGGRLPPSVADRRGHGSPGWRRICIQAGACGDATGADAERGRTLVEHAAQTLIALLREIDRYPLERLRSRPGRATP